MRAARAMRTSLTASMVTCRRAAPARRCRPSRCRLPSAGRTRPSAPAAARRRRRAGTPACRSRVEHRLTHPLGEHVDRHRIPRRGRRAGRCDTTSGTVTYSGSVVVSLSARRATGRFTSTPFCIIGAATMKMMSSTSITSTSGMTLISDSDVETRRPRRRPVFASGVRLMHPSALGEVPFRDVQELEREVVHLRRVDLHLRGEVVVEVDGRNRGEQAERRGDQRFGNRPARPRPDPSSPARRCS